jgi:hypothetical protein
MDLDHRPLFLFNAITYNESNPNSGGEIRNNTITSTPGSEPPNAGMFFNNAFNMQVTDNILNGFTAANYQMYVGGGSNNNYFTNNIIGPLAPGAIAGIVCGGQHNDIEYNDFTNSMIPGWEVTPNGQGCILLGEGTRGNHIRQNTFPSGTTMCDQIMDLDVEFGVIGTPQGMQDAIPGYGACHSKNPDVVNNVQNALANRPQPEPFTHDFEDEEPL